MHRFRPLLAFPLLLALVTFPSAVSGNPIGNTDVLVFLVGEPSASIHLGGEASFIWIAYNNGTTSYLLVVTPPAIGVLTYSLNVHQTVLRPSESAEFRLRVQAPRYGSAQTIGALVMFEATDLTTGSGDTTSFTLQLALRGTTVAGDPQGKLLGLFQNPLPPPLDNEWASFGITIGFWLLVGGSILYGIAPILKRVARATPSRLDDAVLAIVRGPVILLLVLFGVVNSLAILGLPSEWRELIGRAYGFALALVLTWIAYRVFRDLVIAYGQEMARRSATNLDDRLFPALEKLGAVVIVIFGITMAIQGLGYDITLFLAGLGVIGLIIAFAAQDTLSNFFAGIHLMLDRPFRKGDLIQLETGEICEVRDIGLRSTKLYWGKGNVVLILPNNKIAGTKVINFERPDLPFKVHVTVGVGYGSDIDRVKRGMLDIARSHPEALKDEKHPPTFLIDEFGDSAVQVRLIFWVPGPRDQWRVASDVRETILRRFRAEGIEIPFPQRVVWSRAQDDRVGTPEP